MNLQILSRDIVDHIFANTGAGLVEFLQNNPDYGQDFARNVFEPISRNFAHFKELMERFRDEQPAQFDRAKPFETRFLAFKQWAIAEEPCLADNPELDTAWARHLFSKISDGIGGLGIEL